MAAVPSSASVPAGAAFSGISAAASASAVSASGRKWMPWLAGSLVLAAVAIGTFFLSGRHARALTDKDTVVLSEFVKPKWNTQSWRRLITPHMEALASFAVHRVFFM